MPYPSGRLPIAVAGALLLLTPPASASLDQIEPVVDRRAYTALLDGLRIDGDDQMIAEILFSDYAASLQDLAERIDHAAEEAGRRRMQDALSGKIYVERDELRDLRVAVERTYQTAWAEADELLADLRLNVRSLVDDSGDTPESALAFAAFNRSVLLHPRRIAARDEAYAGDGVDVIALVDEASGAGDELEALDRTELDPILDHYAGALDRLLVATAAEDRRGRGARALARIRRDRDATRREEKLSLDRWKRLYLLNRQAVEEVAAVTAERLGSEAERRWRERFDRACFPRLFEATRTDKEHAWIARSRLDQEIRARADAIHDAFRATHADRCREAIALMLRGRLTHACIVHPGTNASTLEDSSARDLYRGLLKNSGEREKLATDAAGALEGLLTERQRKQMRADIAAAAHGRRR